MECCSKCFKKICRCGKQKVELDYYIYPAIYELNRKGYKTLYSCSGHENDTNMSMYISFVEDVETDISSDYFQFETYNYKGIHERRNRIRVKPDIAQKYKKKRTNKLKLIQEINKDIYEWAKNLPPKIASAGNGIEFAPTYFDEEKESNEIVDVQKPWLLFTKSSKNSSRTAVDFFDEIGREKDLAEIIVSSSGRIKRFDDKDYVYQKNKNFLQNKIEFDLSGDFKYLACGYEPYMMIEKVLVENTAWYLTYARTDVAVEYGDAEGYRHPVQFDDDDDIDYMLDDDYDDIVNDCDFGKKNNQMESFVDEYDVEDFFDDHKDSHDIELFTYLFNRMCRMGIHICVFSAENINIIFTNRIDYNVLFSDGESVIAFGDADYEELDFLQIGAEKKEVHVYVNGRILMKKELE